MSATTATTSGSPISKFRSAVDVVRATHRLNVDTNTGRVVGAGTFSAGTGKTKAHVVSDYSAFLFDMDGVLQRCGKAIDGAGDFLRHLRSSDIPFIVLTNECRWSNDALSSKLNTLLGTQLTPKEIYSAANSTRDFFARMIRHGFHGSTYVIGEDGVKQNLAEAYAGMSNNGERLLEALVLSGEDEFDPKKHAPVDFVVVGSVNEENTRFSERAAEFVRKGARVLQTCSDWFDRRDDGSLCFGMPMTTCALFKEVLGVSAYNLGKPNPHMLRMAQDLLLQKKETIQWKDVLFVGDSLGTDIRTAVENGVDVALVMSGTTTKDKLARSAIQPNFIFDSIRELGQEFTKKKDK